MSSLQTLRVYYTRLWNRMKNFWTRSRDFFCFTRSEEGESLHEQQSHTQQISFNNLISSNEEKNSVCYEDLDPENFRMFYNMNHRRRGMAVIFNHENYMFNSFPKRTGTDKDRDRLKAALELLGFEVIVFENMTTANIFQELVKVASMDHSDCDCFVITVLTHGSRDNLYSFDGAYTLRDMTMRFNDENCPTLVRKPRLFFIQACRGDLLDSGYNVPGQYSYRKNFRTLSATSHDAGQFASVNVGKVHEQETFEEEFLHNQPAYSDFLIARSTMIDYASLRNKDIGSWFIQDLCGELENNGTHCDILNLLTRVNWAVSEREGTDIPSGPLYKKKVTLCITTKLLKILQFNIKH